MTSTKEPLLYLCHRIPFPPNKGDKIRSFNILKKLSENFDIHLGCFIDDPFDKQYVEELNKYCRSVYYLDQNKTLAKIKGLQAFITKKPITLPYYFDKCMQQWVNRIISQQNIDKIFVYSSSMAQYCQDRKNAHSSSVNFSALQRVIDFVDVDSDKWRQYADKKTGISKWVFNREHRLLAKVEDEICQQFNHSLFVSPDEAELFRQRQPIEKQSKVHGVLNGVDTNFFDPQAEFSNEALVPSSDFISFTGAMDYWANVDSVLWFVENVWPKILLRRPQAKFVIVGGNPSAEVKGLVKVQGVIVTGRVHDVRPFIAKAKCIVAPLRIARGIQNKVLEAMSLNKPVILTSMAMEGINAPNSENVHIIDEPDNFADCCIEYLSNQQKAEIKNREWILEQFTWQQTLEPLGQYFK
ncbi:MAG: TIGR03087 family PEP-CTERM/XrtA system glycosyltransferase [Colwellia sp.]|nr:TIGR03087 family PEP-CTERM/XrtA system glycosyltransferase [Colwellia sp.]